MWFFRGCCGFYILTLKKASILAYITQYNDIIFNVIVLLAILLQPSLKATKINVEFSWKFDLKC